MRLRETLDSAEGWTSFHRFISYIHHTHVLDESVASWLDIEE